MWPTTRTVTSVWTPAPKCRQVHCPSNNELQGPIAHINREGFVSLQSYSHLFCQSWQSNWVHNHTISQSIGLLTSGFHTGFSMSQLTYRVYSLQFRIISTFLKVIWEGSFYTVGFNLVRESEREKDREWEGGGRSVKRGWSEGLNQVSYLQWIISVVYGGKSDSEL